MINSDEIKNYRYFIRSNGKIIPYHKRYTVGDEKRKEIGNDFNSIEEAEKAVEKLKAWKRLKDKGFRLLDYYHRLGETKSKGEIGFEMNDYEDTKQDLDLLFGGEE